MLQENFVSTAACPGDVNTFWIMVLVSPSYKPQWPWEMSFWH